MRIELGELDRAELSELWLKRYALIKDIEALQRQLGDLRGKIAPIETEIRQRQLDIAKGQKNDVKPEDVQPVIEDYRLVGLEIPDEEDKEQ